MLRLLQIRNIEDDRCLKSFINLLTLLFLFENINQFFLFNYHFYININDKHQYYNVWNLLMVQHFGMCLSSISFISYLMKTKHFFLTIIAQVMYNAGLAIYLMFYLKEQIFDFRQEQSSQLSVPKEEFFKNVEFQNKMIKNFILIIINLVGFMIIFISQKYYLILFNVPPLNQEEVTPAYYNVTLMNYGLCDVDKCDDKCDCSICFETKHQSLVGVLSCGHIFHSGCLIKWVNEKREESSCPLCRGTL